MKLFELQRDRTQTDLPIIVSLSLGLLLLTIYKISAIPFLFFSIYLLTRNITKLTSELIVAMTATVPHLKLREIFYYLLSLWPELLEISLKLILLSLETAQTKEVILWSIR